MAGEKKILLIDDEEDFCFFVKKNLEKTGEFQVLTATKGEEGINLARNKNPDLILLDIVMPQVSGPDVAEALLNNSETKQIPLIFLTAMVTEEEIGDESIKQIGGRPFIAKPVDAKKLASSINMVLGQKSKA